MHIHLLITSLENGGAQKVAATLVNEWAKNHRVTLLLFQDIVEYPIDEGVEKVVLNVKRSPVRFKTGFETFTASLKLKKYIEAQDGKLTVFGILESANLVLAAVKRILPDRFTAVGGSHTNVLRYGLYSKLFRIYRYLDKLVTVSQPMEKFFRNSGVKDESVCFIPNPVDMEFIRDRASEELPEDLKSILSEKRIILGVGRLVAVKNFELLIRAFAQFSGRQRDFVLVILGEGEERSSLEKLIETLQLKDRVILPGHRSNPWVWMKHSALFTLSSDYEGWPNVLIEALVLGTPIVSTDCVSGPSEILKGGKLGRLVPTGDVAAMAEALESSLDSAGRVVENRDWRADIVADRYLQLLNEV